MRHLRRLRRGGAGLPGQARPRVRRAVALGTPRAGRRELVALAALLLLAALARFATVGEQSLWLDEIVTAELMAKPFGGLIDTIPESESTPYLYYVLLWLWTQVAGDGDVALRSLSALFGLATVAAIWAGGRALASPRAGLWAAALAAVNPFLIWYSQEARAYALLALLCAVSFWCFARALDDRRWLLWWAIASALALATHYFAAFVIVPEAIALALLAPRTRAFYAACGGIAAAALALVPLAAQQRRGGGADWIGDISLGHRIAEIPKRFVAGEFGNQLGYVFWPVLACALAALALLWLRGRGQERRGGIVALAVGGAGLAVPIVFALATLDYVFPRNLIGSLPVLLVAFGAALAVNGARRAGTVLFAIVLALSALATVRVATDDRLQRDDWSQVSADLDRHRARVVVVSPRDEARTLRWHRPNMPFLVAPGVVTTEVGILGLTRAPVAERPQPPLPAGFRPVAILDRDTYRLVVARAAGETVVGPEQVRGKAFAPGNAQPLADLSR